MIPFLFLITIVMIPFTGRIKTESLQEKTGYNLSSPDKRIILPDKLREVSGITIIDSGSVGLIQDESGILYIYDIRENRVKTEILFAGNGDYEDLTMAEKAIYVLRSDGTLFEISDFMSKNFKVFTYKTGIPSNDNEGLCYDRINDRLLIGCKGEIKKDKFKNKQAIYAFDIKTKKLIPEPVYIFDLLPVNIEVADKKNSAKEVKVKKAKYEIRTSAIAIHPGTGKLFLLSATDYILCIVNTKGTIEIVKKLDNELFPQAEGIAFLPNGDMLITNEAKDKKPTLIRFNYKANR
jgi:hypothetical protein